MPSTPSSQTTRESSAVEDYLEKILELIDSKGYARVADLAEALGIAQPSVSNMMRRLDAKGLLRHEKYRGVTLTESGEKLARRITKRHEMLAEFLELMGIEADTAYRDLEGMEHHISSQTFRGIEQLVEELRKDPEMQKRIREATAGDD